MGKIIILFKHTKCHHYAQPSLGWDSDQIQKPDQTAQLKN